MKKLYASPEVRVQLLHFEKDFLLSGLDNPPIGSLDDPEDENPWINP